MKNKPATESTSTTINTETGMRSTETELQIPGLVVPSTDNNDVFAQSKSGSTSTERTSGFTSSRGGGR